MTSTLHTNIDYSYLANDDVFIIKKGAKTYFYNDYKNILSDKKPILEKSISTKHSEKNEARLKIIPSNKCNLNCIYCFSKHDRENNELLEFSSIEQLLVEFIKKNNNANLSVLFTGGGEPTLNFDCIKHCVSLLNKHKNVTYEILTNGVFPKIYRDFFIDNNFKIGLSLDGCYETQILQQKNFMSPAVFSHIIDNFCFLQNKGLSVYVTTVISAELLYRYKDNVDKLISLTIEYLFIIGVKYVNISFDSHIFKLSFDKSLMDTIYEYSIRLLNWKKSHPTMYVVNYHIYAQIDSFSPKAKCADLIYFPSKSITIAPDGNYTFCHIEQNSALKLSNINLNSNINPLLSKPIIKNLLNKTFIQKKTCHHCIARQTCMKNICPITLFSMKKVNRNFLCENNIYLRKRMLAYFINLYEKRSHSK